MSKRFLTLLLLPVLAACGASAAGETEVGPEQAAVERRNLEVRAEAAGLIEPIRVVEVKSKASGEVLQMIVETGDEVRKGALLATIDPRDVRNAFAQAEADLQVARERLQTAEAQRERAEALRKSNVATDQEFESAAMEEANARAQLVKARTNLELARERLGDVTIRAPIDGTVIQKDVEAGQIIASASSNVSGGTTLLLMADLAEMQVRTLVDETDIGLIRPELSARVSVEAFPGRSFQGRVYKIEPQAVVEQNVTMFPVLVRLDNRERLLKPGMNAEVEIEIATRQDVVAVPNAAVVSTRDAAAAAGAIGMSEDALREAMERGRGGRVENGAGGAANAASESKTPPTAAAPASGDASGMSAECEALRRKMREGGLAALSDADRVALRGCRPAGGSRGGGSFSFGAGGRAPGGAGAATGAAGGNVRPGIVFVAGASGPEPRRVMLGLNDWDYTEVLSGVEPGESVYLISVARLQQQQQEFANRMRERAGGMFPGQQARPQQQQGPQGTQGQQPRGQPAQR